MFNILKPCRLLSCLLLTFCGGPAAAFQDPSAIKKSIADYLRIQTKGLSGQVSFSIGGIDAQNNLAACPSFDVSLPVGARAWGRTSVQVRCQVADGWSIYVPVHIRVFGLYLLAAKPLARGQILNETDIISSSGDLTDLPAGILTEASQAIGKIVDQPVPSGRPLRLETLRQAFVVQQGQSIKVISNGSGFQVTGNDGRALNNAVEGQVVQVRMPNGKILSGLARTAGVVEINY